MTTYYFRFVPLVFFSLAVFGAPYADMTYDEMVEQVLGLARDAPEYARVFSGNAEFRVEPAKGSCGTVHASCETWIVVVGTQHATNSPEVFLSGALHGDERVGPLATLATARLLALGSQCHDDETKCSLLTDDERASLTPERLRWLNRLTQSRVVYAAPATNALGYSKSTRTENGVDPNRDFPIDTSPYNCMKSQTAKVVNELFRRHSFQIVVTFHGGMRALAYEWGAPTFARRDSRVSPDEASQYRVGKVLATAAGSFRHVPKYAVDRMNSIVYPVHGGMEDWAYAGSWSTQLQVKGGCRTPNYSSSRTSSYSNSSLRAFALLVETSDRKSGPESEMGSEEAVFSPDRVKDGHVSRNVRLALAAVDIVQPYLEWRQSPDSTKMAWTVGGASRVDETVLRVKCGEETRDVVGTRIEEPLENILPNIPVRAYTAALPRCALGVIEAAAVARVDSEWGKAPSSAKPSYHSPQTHLANARTNPEWRHSHNGHKIVGKIEWTTATTTATTSSGANSEKRRLAVVSTFSGAALFAWWKRCLRALFFHKRRR